MKHLIIEAIGWIFLGIGIFNYLFYSCWHVFADPSGKIKTSKERGVYEYIRKPLQEKIAQQEGISHQELDSHIKITKYLNKEFKISNINGYLLISGAILLAASMG